MAARINIAAALGMMMMMVTIMPMLLEAAQPTRHTVGEAPGWAPKVDYKKWSKNQKFGRGDYLDFNYDNKTYNVASVNKDEYQRCKAGSKVDARTTGHDQIQLFSPVYYFISTTTKSKAACLAGMKLQINLVDAKA